MKMKFSLKNLKLKELLIEHVEKGVLAIGCVLLLMFLVSAAGREKLPPEREPERLSEMTQQTKTHVEKSTFSPKLVEAVPPDYSNRVRRDPVLLATYDTPTPFDGPIVDAKLLRDEPPVLAVRDLRVTPGFGPFALQSPDMAENRVTTRRPRPGMEDEPLEEVRMVDRAFGQGVKVPKGAKLVVKYWAMVTGLIPIREQKEQFFKTFGLASGFDSEADLPNYLGYQIERAEVTSDSKDDLKWESISKDANFMLQWAVDVPELVSPEFITPKFVTPLGPLVGTDWGDYVAHLPEIKLEERRRPGGGGMAGFEGMGPGGMRGGRPMGDAMPGGPGGGGARGGFGGEGYEEEDEAADMFESSRIRRRTTVEEESPEERRRRAEVVGVISEKQIKGVDHLLFRFCDFSVESGKKYVYRVRLGLGNPNRFVPVKNLRKPELREAKALISEWSKPTPVANIPYGDKLLAGPVSPATLRSEPVGKIRIVQVKEDIGAEVPLESEVSRGSLINFLKAETEYVGADGTVNPFTGDFLTDSVVLDLRGGKSLQPKTKELTEPGEMLVLSREGQLLAMHEFEDEDTWFNYAVPEEKPRGEAVDPMMMEMEGMPRPGGRPAPGGPRPGRPPRGAAEGNDDLLLNVPGRPARSSRPPRGGR